MSLKTSSSVLIIGAGLAGSDAAYYLANRGVKVILLESKQLEPNPAQTIPTAAELVCTNSLKSLEKTSAHGILKSEMAGLGSLVLKIAEECAVPAGHALAVDRVLFSQKIDAILKQHPLITFKNEVVADPLQAMEQYQCDYVLLATGPLTLPSLESWITKNLTQDDWYFYDAIAPVVDAHSLNHDIVYAKGRYDKGGSDYLNAPFNKEQYEKFIQALIQAEKVPPKKFEDYKFFESCLPVDVMAERGPETARFSCMKPVGLERDDGTMPYAVVQLRKENLLGDAYNIVGFQTRLTYPEQQKVFRMIPGLEQVEFLRFGSVHRNSFLNSRKLLQLNSSSREFPRLFFAGQMTGVEGYTESASMGLYAAVQIWRKLCGKEELLFPLTTAIGALVNYIHTWEKPVPSNINFGLFPAIDLPAKRNMDRKKMRGEAVANRAQASFNELVAQNQECFL